MDKKEIDTVWTMQQVAIIIICLQLLILIAINLLKAGLSARREKENKMLIRTMQKANIILAIIEVEEMIINSVKLERLKFMFTLITMEEKGWQLTNLIKQ